MQRPFFLDAARVHSATESKRLLFCGSLAHQILKGATLPEAKQLVALPRSILPYIARDLALLPLLSREPVLRMIPELEAITLAGPGSPTLAQMKERLAAMCLYPMTGTGAVSALGLVFVVEGEESPFRVGPPSDGLSWTLAEGLCRRLLDENEDCKFRIALAKDWIVTGELEEEIVHRVRMGNKGRIECGNRIWMLPGSNYYQADLPPNTRSVAVGNLAGAVAHVTGKGIRDSETPVPWPTDVDEFHSLSSGAMGPVLMATLFTGRVPIYLWTSENEEISVQPARAVHWLLTTHLGYRAEAVRISEKQISSYSIAEAARLLGAELKSTLREGKRILFNITQGNLLMRFAVIELARIYPHLSLVYREVGSKELDVFEWVRFEGGVPVTQRIRGEEKEENVNWDALRNPNVKPNAYNVEDVAAKFLLNSTEKQ